MMELKKLAAIDIGSNGVRLLIMNVASCGERTVFKKSSLVRVPIRLGEDAFLRGEISPGNIERLIEAMRAFRGLMSVNGVEDYRAVATSALFSSINRERVVARVREACGVEIRVIDGALESRIIASSELKNIIEKKRSYLMIDVGGGSSEISVFRGGERLAGRSFEVGSVRLLMGKHDPGVWGRMRGWIEENLKSPDDPSAIGSGGNIHTLFKMSGKAAGKPLSLSYLTGQYLRLKAMSVEERIFHLGMNPDRADVIVPALKIYFRAMLWGRISRIYVPKFGLSDGIVKCLHADLL